MYVLTTTHLLLFYLLYHELMAKEKTSFIVRKKYRKQIELLDNEKAWMLFKAIMKLQDWEVLENTDPVVDMLISIMEEEREQDNEHYEEVCKKNRENGSKGWRPKKNRTVISETEWNPTEPKKADNDNDYDNDNKKKEDNKLSSKEKTPSVSELLKAYEQNELLVWRIQNSQAVREWLEYKQKKKDRAYKSEKAFIQRLAIIVKTLDNWLPRPDIWERLSYAVNIATEKEWKDIYRTEQTELDYQSFKKFNSMQWTNKQQHE